MYVRCTASNDEVNTLSDELRPLIQQGDTVREFIRRNPEALRRVVEEKSWKTLAAVMTTLGMTYKTGTPWTRGAIQREFVKASTPFKERRGRRKSEPAVLQNIDVPPPPESAEGSLDIPRRAAPHPAGAIEAPPRPVMQPKPMFEPFTLKDQEPRRELTPEELRKIEETKIRIFGKATPRTRNW